jgi:hypothetical protein
MTYRRIQASSYVKRDPGTGAVVSLQCKVCGDTIADTQDRTTAYEVTRSGERVKVVKRQYVHFANYTEAKIEFTDGSFHITNGCDKCLTAHMSLAVVKEMYRADQEDSPDGYTDIEQAREPARIVRVVRGTEGIT